jgi:flagellar motility protein MotE (MotC chaperone)
MRIREVLLIALASTALAATAEETPPASPADVAREALEIEVRQAALKMLADETVARLDELTKLRAELESMVQPIQAEAETDLATLIKFYEAMKPKNAASLLEKLPPDLAADLLGAMKSRQAGKILDAMQADRAVRISRLMAGDGK